MAQVLIRGVSEETVERLRSRARENERSLEQELRLVLDAAAKPTLQEALARAEALRERTVATHGVARVSAVELLREDRER